MNRQTGSLDAFPLHPLSEGEMHETTGKMPRELHHRPASSRPGTFQVVDAAGSVWADGIPTEDAARVFAASSSLLLGYEWLFEEAFEYFHARWNLTMRSPDFEEFLLDDDGELDRRYPGAPAHAVWLQDLKNRACSARPPSGEHPVEPYSDPQSELF